MSTLDEAQHAHSIEEDAVYLQAIAAGNKNALESLFNKYQHSVYQTILGVTRDEQLSEEILQDTFFRLYRTAPRLDTTLPLAPWLYRVAINLCYSRLRGLRAWTHSFHLLAERLFAPALNSPERTAERNDTNAVLHATLAQLDPMHRAVLVLYYLHEYSIGEIAGVVGVPEGTVKSRLFHARKLLKARLEQHYGDPELLLPDLA